MTEFEVNNLQSGLNNLGKAFDRVDPEKIRRETLRRSAAEMAEMVRQAVVEEDGISSPARLNSEYEHGPGPSMASRKAWQVTNFGDQYIVKPHPEVRQRAIVLNYGYPGEITPNTADKLVFTVNGVPREADSVEGPDYTGYWQAAMRRFAASDKIGEIGREELNEEFEEST